MNAGLCVMQAFLFSALSPVGLSVSPGLGSGEDVAFMRRRPKRSCVHYPSHRAHILFLYWYQAPVNTTHDAMFPSYALRSQSLINEE